MYNIQEIKDKINCLDVAQRYHLPIHKEGDRCVSPLRAGATNKTSFVVYKDFWYDFGSAKGGDVIDLVAELEYEGDKGDAIRALAHCTGVDGTDDRGWHDYTVNLNAKTAFYHSKLTDSDRDYLHNRGLTDADIDRLMIGRVTDGDLRGRLFLPYFFNGYVCYYATRAMPGGEYPESKYRKQKIDDYCQHVPWGMQTLNRGGDTLVIAEGYFDAVSFEAQGYPVLSAVTGFFSSTQLPMVLNAAKQFKRVFFVYDNDERSHAGEKFAERMARTLLKERIPFIVGRVPDEYKDVSEYYEAGEVLQNLVNNATNGLTYLCNAYKEADELVAFLRPIARDEGVGVVTKVLQEISERGDITQAMIREIEKRVCTPPGDLEIAHEIMQKYSIMYMDCAGFYLWNGNVWQRATDTVIRKLATNVLGKFSNAGRIANACNQLKALAVNNDVVFDKKPVFTFPNGTLELETGTFRESRKDDYCTICMSYDYNPHSICPEWEQFIKDVTDGCGKRYENLHYLPGYALMPHCDYQKIFIFLGKGGNGKSIYLDTLKCVFGSDNVSTVEPSSLPQDFQRITLKDSLLNVGSDISSDFTKGEVREWLLKIAGGEMIQACYKGKDYIKFEPRCKLVFACNTIPTAEVVNGLERRFQFVEFPCRFVENPDPKDRKQKKRDEFIKSKLLSELPGIFNWVYKGYREFREKGWIVETDEQERLLRQFKTISNPIEEFCEDVPFYESMTRDEVYSRYRYWCEDAGHKPLSRTKFIPKFRDVMDEKIEDEQYVRREGKRTWAFKFKMTDTNRRDQQ